MQQSKTSREEVDAYWQKQFEISPSMAEQFRRRPDYIHRYILTEPCRDDVTAMKLMEFWNSYKDTIYLPFAMRCHMHAMRYYDEFPLRFSTTTAFTQASTEAVT